MKLTPSIFMLGSLVFSPSEGRGQAWNTELFGAGLGSLTFTMATKATLKLTLRA